MSRGMLKNVILLLSLAANVILGAVATHYWLRSRATQLGLASDSEALSSVAGAALLPSVRIEFRASESKPISRRSRCDCLPEVAPSKFPSRPGFQIPFELESGFFLVELDNNQRSPRPMLGRVWRESPVVSRQSFCHGGGNAHVVRRRNADALENVNEASWLGHGSRRSNSGPSC